LFDLKSQGDALGWDGVAPLALIRQTSVQPDCLAGKHPLPKALFDLAKGRSRFPAGMTNKKSKCKGKINGKDKADSLRE